MDCKDYILSMQNVTKKFVGTVALRDVSFDLAKGEVLAVVGENGAGKSTLMKILSGNYPIDTYDGMILVNGKSCKFNDVKDAEKAGIVMIHQEINLELDLSIAENIQLGALPVKFPGIIDWKAVNDRAKILMEKVGLSDFNVETRVRNLSISDQQLVSIARALNRDSKILILDEPTSSLNAEETVTLFNIIRDLSSQGLSCIFISHKIKEVLQICDRAIVLRDGRKISQYTKSEFNSDRIIQDIVGRSLDQNITNESRLPGEEVLRVENLTIPHPYANDKAILENISFNLRKGEILGLYGLVGSGRSELLGCVFGSIRKLSGEIYVFGQIMRNYSQIKAKQLGIGMVTEDRKKDGFIGTMTVTNNICLTVLEEISNLFIIHRNKERKIAGNFVDKLRIKTSSMDVNANTLSGGNQQKIILAKWLATQSKILLLDEPTRGIDIGTKTEIYSLIKELATQGISIIVTSSEVDELIGLGDRFLVLSHGHISKEMTKEEATQANLIFYSLTSATT